MNRRNALLAAVLAVGVLLTCGAVGQEKSTPMVYVYATYFEADGMRFESIDELRTYLLSASNNFFAVFIRDCAAKGREQEVMKVITEVVAKRLAQKGKIVNVSLGVGSIPCP